MADPLRAPVDLGGPLPNLAGGPAGPHHTRDPPLFPPCITMHSHAAGPNVLNAAIRAGRRRVSFLAAAKDRNFKTVRLNQGTATETVPIRRSESGNRHRDCSDPQMAVVVNHQDRPG